MASSMKFTHNAMIDQNDHINREHDNPSNTEIDPKRTHLNYSFPMTYKEQRPFEYYKQRGGEVYTYRRGTKRIKRTPLQGVAGLSPYQKNYTAIL